MKNEARQGQATLKILKANSAGNNLSPYLKAILSCNNRLFDSAHPGDQSDRDAALRYIRESRLLHKK